MSQTPTTRPASHDLVVGELVALTAAACGFESRRVCQILGFKGEKRLRLLPIAGIPIIVPVEQVMRIGLPAGSARLPQRRRRWHGKRKPKKPAPAAA